MPRRPSLFILRPFSITVGLLEESLRFGRGLFRSQASLVAENRFLRRQPGAPPFAKEREGRCDLFAAGLLNACGFQTVGRGSGRVTLG